MALHGDFQVDFIEDPNVPTGLERVAVRRRRQLPTNALRPL